MRALKRSLRSLFIMRSAAMVIQDILAKLAAELTAKVVAKARESLKLEDI